MELSGSIIMKFLIFPQKKSFFILQEMETFYISGEGDPEKNSYIFSEKSFFYISGKRKPQKDSLCFRKQKPKKTFILQEVSLSTRKSKISYVFSYKETE